MGPDSSRIWGCWWAVNFVNLASPSLPIWVTLYGLNTATSTHTTLSYNRYKLRGKSSWLCYLYSVDKAARLKPPKQNHTASRGQPQCGTLAFCSRLVSFHPSTDVWTLWVDFSTCPNKRTPKRPCNYTPGSRAQTAITESSLSASTPVKSKHWMTRLNPKKTVDMRCVSRCGGSSDVHAEMTKLWAHTRLNFLWTQLTAFRAKSFN